jgi:hypothetical protein
MRRVEVGHQDDWVAHTNCQVLCAKSSKKHAQDTHEIIYLFSNFCFKISFATFGLALPRVAFINLLNAFLKGR